MLNENTPIEIDVIMILEELWKYQKEFCENKTENPRSIKIEIAMTDEIKNSLIKQIERFENNPNKTIKQYLQVRNMQNLVSKTFFCCLTTSDPQFPTACWFCHFGHATECHFPYDCESEFCKHYPEEEKSVSNDGLDTYRALIYDIYNDIIKKMCKKAKDSLKNFDLYKNIESENQCEICLEKSNLLENQLYVFFDPTGTKKICFHKNCMIGD